MSADAVPAGPDPGLLAGLLRDAGLPRRVDAIAPLGESSNRVWELRIGRARYVLRERLDGSTSMPVKEAYLGDLLARHDVPAVGVLAAAGGDRPGTLTTYASGIPLTQARRTLAQDDLAAAWRSTGEAVRRAHEIALPVGPGVAGPIAGQIAGQLAGEIVGDRVEAFEGGWAVWVTGEIAETLGWLRARLGLPPLDELAERFAVLARAALSEPPAPVRLVHNDLLPQNVLVAPGPEGWGCTALLDWEFARAGDPRWDLATLELRAARLVPAAFRAGYGEPAVEPYATIYEVLTMAWKTRAQLQGHGDWEWSSLDARLAYVRDLERHLTSALAHG